MFSCKREQIYSRADKETGILNGKLRFKALRDGSLIRTHSKSKVICIHCRCELSYRSTLSLKYHLLAKHTADAESPALPQKRQTTLGSLQRRSMDNSATNKLSAAKAKWVATACRPIITVVDQGLLQIVCIASNDCTYELHLRATTVTKIHNLFL